MKLKFIFSILRSIFSTVYFNFHYLPLKQAVKLPILLYKPHFIKLKGKITLLGNVRTGMVQMGFNQVEIYPHTGITLEILEGAQIIIKGTAIIGNNSYISVGEHGRLEIQGDFRASTSLRLVCWHNIVLDECVRIGWEVLIMDTGFHRMKYQDGGFCSKGFAPIHICRNTWIATRCFISPGATIPAHSVVGSNSLVNKAFEGEYLLIAGVPAKIKKTGVYRDPYDDKIIYE